MRNDPHTTDLYRLKPSGQATWILTNLAGQTPKEAIENYLKRDRLPAAGSLFIAVNRSLEAVPIVFRIEGKTVIPVAIEEAGTTKGDHLSELLNPHRIVDLGDAA